LRTDYGCQFARSSSAYILATREEEITERKCAEERLRGSEARFQAMADTAPVMIWLTGTDVLAIIQQTVA
jgi:PAS domain-containing protein